MVYLFDIIFQSLVNHFGLLMARQKNIKEVEGVDWGLFTVCLQPFNSGLLPFFKNIVYPPPPCSLAKYF